jgi:uncharacterized metal-binding protein
MPNIVPYISAIFAILTTIILALIGFGLKTQLEALRNEFHVALAAAQIQFFSLVNGKYVSKENLELRLAALEQKKVRTSRK